MNFGYNNVRIDQVQDLQALLNGISNNLINYIKLSKLLLSAKYYDPNLNSRLKEQFDMVNKQIQVNSQQMFSIDPSVDDYFSQDKIDKTVSRYLIAFSNAIVTGKLQEFSQLAMLNDLVMKIAPSFNALMDRKISDFLVNNRNSVVKSLLLVLGFLCVLVTVLVWVCVVRLHILKKRQAILIVFSRIRDSLLERQLVKIQLFEEYLYFDKDIFCQDNLDYLMKTHDAKGKQNYNSLTNQQKLKGGLRTKFSWKTKKPERNEEEQRQRGSENKFMIKNIQMQQMAKNNQVNNKEDGTLYMKWLINVQSIRRICIFTIVWILCMGVVQFFLYRTVMTFATVSQKIFRIQYNIQRMHSSSDMVWILLNYFPYNEEQLDFYEAEMYRAESDFKAEVISMAQGDMFSEEFLEFYEEIWTQDACKYIGQVLPECRTVLNGALAEGADQIIAYLNRKYDFFMATSLAEKDFHSKQIIKTLSNLELQYMTEIVKVNMQKLGVEHNMYVDAFERELFVFFILTLIGLGFVGLVYKMLSIENENLIKLQRLFKLIDFDSLKDVNEFKLYFKENYHDKLFK